MPHQKPVGATAIILTIICTLAFAILLVRLAEFAFSMTLAVFVVNNLSLVALTW